MLLGFHVGQVYHLRLRFSPWHNNPFATMRALCHLTAKRFVRLYRLPALRAVKLKFRHSVSPFPYSLPLHSTCGTDWQAAWFPLSDISLHTWNLTGRHPFLRLGLYVIPLKAQQESGVLFTSATWQSERKENLPSYSSEALRSPYGNTKRGKRWCASSARCRPY